MRKLLMVFNAASSNHFRFQLFIRTTSSKFQIQGNFLGNCMKSVINSTVPGRIFSTTFLCGSICKSLPGKTLFSTKIHSGFGCFPVHQSQQTTAINSCSMKLSPQKKPICGTQMGVVGQISKRQNILSLIFLGSSMVKFIFPKKKQNKKMALWLSEYFVSHTFNSFKPHVLIYFRFNLIKSCEKELWKKKKKLTKIHCFAIRKKTFRKPGVNIPHFSNLTHLRTVNWFRAPTSGVPLFLEFLTRTNYEIVSKMSGDYSGTHPKSLKQLIQIHNSLTIDNDVASHNRTSPLHKKNIAVWHFSTHWTYDKVMGGNTINSFQWACGAVPLSPDPLYLRWATSNHSQTLFQQSHDPINYRWFFVIQKKGGNKLKPLILHVCKQPKGLTAIGMLSRFQLFPCCEENVDACGENANVCGENANAVKGDEVAASQLVIL
ncbi:hypothetical protein VP01_1178g1 [Puccinia sorghi]|uniref:Uncharacterized protein n=1 Tax=Puccinia sorghi TaxID=27349 RepID=A0A0L6VR25_9BASI|nr:hypothetical protein VP01_1178g1 [Puccinia sorghi]